MSWVYKAKMDTVSKEPAGWQEGRLRHPAETVPVTIWKIREPWDSSLLTHREDSGRLEGRSWQWAPQQAGVGWVPH